MKSNKQTTLIGCAFICMVTALFTLTMLGMAGCCRTPAQQAEKAFVKLFENDYPEWKVTKIILTPCVAKNRYRGRFVCMARKMTTRCCAKVWFSPDCFDYKSQPGYVPCSKLHSSDSKIIWSVLVTYAHGDCYYKLADKVSDYE